MYGELAIKDAVVVLLSLKLCILVLREFFLSEMINVGYIVES